MLYPCLSFHTEEPINSMRSHASRKVKIPFRYKFLGEIRLRIVQSFVPNARVSLLVVEFRKEYNFPVINMAQLKENT